jgi:hypothetical protein
MSLIDADPNYLGDLSRFVSWTGYSTVADADGRVERLRTMDVEIRLVDQNLIPWSGWFMETAVVRASAPGLIAEAKRYYSGLSCLCKSIERNQ